MANAIYSKYLQSLLDGDSNTTLTGSGSTGVWAALVDTGTYTFSDSHQYYSDLSGIVGTDVEVENTTTTNGVIDGDNITFSTVSGSTVEALVLYRKNAGANTTWRLIAYIDTNVTGLPVTPSGGDIGVTWNATGICKI